MATMRELFDLYRHVWREHQTNPKRLNAHVAAPKYGIVRHVYVAETDAQALQEAKAAFADFIYNFNYLRLVNGDTSGRAAYLAELGRHAWGRGCTWSAHLTPLKGRYRSTCR